jgi:predicted PurR-regulated permease PerM
MPRDIRPRAAGILLAALGLTLLVALLPYASGLLAGPVLYILWAPLQRRLMRRLPAPVGAAIILFLTLLLIVIPGSWLVIVLVGQAQAAIETIGSSPLLLRVEMMKFGSHTVGPVVTDVARSLIAWVGSNAFSLIGTATRFILGLLFAFVGLYYLLVRPGAAWVALDPYIPLTPERTRMLRDRFEAVTFSTVVGTGLNAVVQGTMVGGALALAGISNAAFWGAITAILSILPLVGSGLVWGPAALGLLMEGRVGAAVALVTFGLVVVANIDNVLRPWVYRRFAHVHPMITLVGAVVGVEYFGLVGLVLGPLGIQYFFELTRMLREEYGAGWWSQPALEPPSPPTTDV